MSAASAYHGQQRSSASTPNPFRSVGSSRQAGRPRHRGIHQSGRGAGQASCRTCGDLAPFIVHSPRRWAAWCRHSATSAVGGQAGPGPPGGAAAMRRGASLGVLASVNGHGRGSGGRGGADCAGRRRGGNLAGAWPLARRSRAETSCGAGVDDPRKATRAGLGRPHRSVAKRVGTQGWKGYFRQAARHTVPLRRQCRGTLMKAVRRWYPSRNGREGSRPRAMSAGERAMSLPGSAPSRTPGTTGGCPRRPRHRSARGCRPSRVTRNALRSSEDHAMSAHPPHRARPGHEHGRRKP